MPTELMSTYTDSVDIDYTQVVPPAQERPILNYLNSAYEEARFGLEQSEDVKQVERYINYLMGRQWPTKRPAYKAAPVDNRLWKMFMGYVSYLTDVRPQWDINTQNKAYIPTATLLKQLTDNWWSVQNVDMALGEIVMYAMLTTGYGMLKWNPALCGGIGDMELKAVGPADLLPLRPQGSDVQSCEGVVYRNIRPLRFFRNKYAKGSLVEADPAFSMGSRNATRPPWIMQGIWDMMSPAMQRVIGVKQNLADSIFPMAEYREYWITDDAINDSKVTVFVGEPGKNWSYKVPPGGKLYPRGRLLITGGTNVLLYDGPNPFWHGRIPFEKLCLNDVPWQWHGPSEFRVQIPLQDVVNQIFAGVLDNVKKAVNPVLISPEGAFSPSVRNTMDPSMPGAKLFFNPNQTPVPPTLANPPNLPGYVMDLLGWTIREMDTHSGLLDLQAISRLGQIPAADTLEQLKESQQTLIRLKGRYIERFLARMGVQGLSNFMQFYTMERRIRIRGMDGVTFQDMDFDPRNMIPSGEDPQKFAQTFAMEMKPGTALASARNQKAYILSMLRARGEVDRTTMLLAMGFNDIEIANIQKNLDQEGKDIFAQIVKAKMSQSGGGGGGGGPAQLANMFNASQGAQQGGAMPQMSA